MTTRNKNITSLMTLTLFGLAFVCDASLASDRDRRAAADEIRACVLEINRNADYADASRVVHWVVGLERKNPTELEVRIETSVYEDNDGAAVKEYRAYCVAGALGALVRFRMQVAGLPEA